MRFVLEFSLLCAFAIVGNNAVPIDSGYMAPQHSGPVHPRMLQYDPALIEELYERGLLEDLPSIGNSQNLNSETSFA